MADPVVNNPATLPVKRASEADRIPMSVPQLRMAVPERPGWHRHWFVAKNVARALRAGYSFVDQDDVEVNNPDVAGSINASGSTDMGTRVSTLAGGFMEGTTEPDRLYLMELPQNLRDKDMQELEARNEQIAAALRGGHTAPGGTGGGPSETPGDRARRYMKTGQDLFYPKVRRS